MALLAAVALLAFFHGGCSDDPERVRVDLDHRVAVESLPAPRPEAALNVAIAAMISPNATLTHYHALLEYLGAKVGRRIHLVQRKTYAEVNGLLGSGGIDLALICSGPYTSGRDRLHFEALAVPEVNHTPVYRALLISQRDSAVEGLEDLRGKVFAFSDPDSNAGWLVPCALLAERGERPETFFGRTIFTYSHDNSILAVARSLVDGAFVHEHIWQYYTLKNPPVASRVRVAYASEAFGNPPLVASAFVPADLRQRIRELLLAMHRDPHGAAILAELMVDRFTPPQERLYDPVRRMLAAARLQEGGDAALAQP